MNSNGKNVKVALLNCYFGKFPNYFGLWLQSCRNNPGIDFILVTDAKIQYEIPSNVIVIRLTWDELMERIEVKFDFPIVITSPYKLTDFKPAYGFVFDDIFAPYDYWGYCDVDLIFGNIEKFISKAVSEEADKIYRLGHLTIYRNTDEMKMLFTKDGGMFSYKEVFSHPEFYSFDEHAGMMSITAKQGVKCFYQEDMADISCRIRRMTASRHENYRYQVFYYEDGSVYRSFIDNGEVKTEEFVYIHIQKRKYSLDGVYERFFILSDRFVEKEAGVPFAEAIKELSEYVSDEQDNAELSAFKKNKLKAFAKSPVREKIIWLKIKKAERNF